MTTRTATRSPSTRTRWALSAMAAAGLALTGLSGGGLAGGVASAASLAAGGSGAADCVSAASAPANARVRLGANGVDPNSLTAAQAAAGERSTRARLAHLGLTERSAAAAAAGEPIDILVHWHVITRNNGSGNVSDARIAAQLRALNRGFAGTASSAAAATPFVFVTSSIDRTANTDWYSWSMSGDDDDTEAKDALGINPQQELNVYLANLDGGVLGYATFPWDGAPAYQGVVLLNGSLPGGDTAPYNRGDTATHEIGHWLGLYHTFQGGCVNPGDYVADTPYQDNGSNIFECEESLDTCAQDGLDPVHNFMSYGDDLCLDRFTAGQSTRMVASYDAWRGPNIG